MWKFILQYEMPPNDFFHWSKIFNKTQRQFQVMHFFLSEFVLGKISKKGYGCYWGKNHERWSNITLIKVKDRHSYFCPTKAWFIVKKLRFFLAISYMSLKFRNSRIFLGKMHWSYVYNLEKKYVMEYNFVILDFYTSF